MSKYIEIDELISVIKTAPVWTGLDAIERIKTLSTIDIVRCKECRHRDKHHYCVIWGQPYLCNDECFCSYGEREGE